MRQRISTINAVIGRYLHQAELRIKRFLTHEFSIEADAPVRREQGGDGMCGVRVDELKIWHLGKG